MQQRFAAMGFDSFPLARSVAQLQAPPPPSPRPQPSSQRSYQREFAERTGTAAPATLSRISKLLLLRRVRTPTAPTSLPFLLTMAASRAGETCVRGSRAARSSAPQ